MADPERPVESVTVRLEEGSRCVCEGFYGTVRYVGEVPPSKGVWLGVEWDDPSRGKHSGDHDGVHYFTCSIPGSGSFIRPKKVSQGCTFIEALKKRYGGESHQLESGEDSEMYVISGSHHTKPVEMVGAEKVARKQSQLDQLVEVSLREMLVSSAGKPGEIEAIAPNIRDLNLSQNLLLSNWKTLADICSQLQHMQTLNLSENRCFSLPTDPVSLAPAFSCLRTLFINKMDLSWSQVCSILNLVPNLEELHACKNKITNLCPPDNISLPVGLRLLNLEENQLSDWSDILQLQHLPLLKTLILNDNKLTQVLFPDASLHSSTCGFPALESLSLNQNHIADWSSLNVLDTFPSLVELKFKSNPLLQGEPAFTARQLVIARIEHLTFLNNSPITDRERQLAERYYLKQYATKWVSSQVDEASRKQFSALHPRYAHLAEVHGLPEEAMVAQQSPASSLKDRLIAVTIKCPDHPEQKQLAKKLPGTMTIQKLKGLLQRMYKVNSSDQKLSYVDKRGECEIELSDDLKQLSFYSIETGDTILLRW